MTSGTGHTTLLHAYIHLRNQQAFQRVIAQVSSAQLSDSGITLATSPKSPKSKHRKDKDDAVDVNARDSLGRTPLHLASAMTEPSSAEYVRMLLKCPGINVNLPDRESGWTALHRAMYIGNLGVILLLLQYPHTDSSAKDYEGYTAFDLYNSTVQGTRPPIGTFIAPATSSKDAELFTWGTNRNASLGHGDTSDRTYPDHVSVPRPLGAPYDITNNDAQSNTPVELRFARAGVRQVKMGRLHTAVISTFPRSSTTVALTSSGVSLCGFGSGGRLGLTQHTQYALRPLPFSGSSSGVGASQNQMPGANPIQAQGQGKIKIISVALGQDHTLALSADGEVYSWGLNRFAQLGYVVEREDSGAFAHSATFQTGDGEFSSEFSGGGGNSNLEQIQLTPRRVYGALKKEFVVGVAACKSASVCWVRTGAAGAVPGPGGGALGSGLVGGSEGGNVYSWGLNNGQLGYERTGSGNQLQTQPRKVTKITKPVVQIALGESAMVCLLGGTGTVKGDVVIVWGDRTARVNFPLHTFPSSITPYRPPQALKSARIVKIVCSDEAPLPWSASTLSALTSSTSGPSTPSTQQSSSTSQLTRMMSAMSANERDSSGSGSSSGSSSTLNLVHFACVSEGGEVFVFGVPGVPPVGTLGTLGSSSSMGSDGFGLDGGFTTAGGGSNAASKLEAVATGKLFKPQRVWGLKRGLVGAVRDVAIGAEGSLIVCTDSGHVYVRSRSNAVAAFDSGVGGSKSSGSSRLGDGAGGTGSGGSGGSKAQKFIRVPSLQRIVGVCASSTGAFGALRVDVDVEPVGNAKDMLMQKSTKGEDDVKGWDLVRDMKSIRPWIWVKKVVSPLEKEWARMDDDSVMGVDAATNAAFNAETGITSEGKSASKEKDDDEDEDDTEIERDMRSLKELVRVFGRVVSSKVDSQWEEKGRLPYGADVMVSRLSTSTTTYSSSGQKKAKKAKASTSEYISASSKPFSAPAHAVILAARSKVLRHVLSSTKEEVLRDATSGITIRVFNAAATSSKVRRQVEFSIVHPLTILILLEYLYTDDLVAVWDRRVARVLDLGTIGHSQNFSRVMKEYAVSPILASQVKQELLTLGRLLDLPEMLRGMESSIKKPVVSTLRKDLETLFWGVKHNNELPGALKTRVDASAAMNADIVLQLAEGKQVYMHSAILRARSVYFDDFLGDEEWTRNRWNESDGLLRIDLKHMRWYVMEYVSRWMCCGIEQEVFGSLGFANSTDEVLEFLFEVISVANELLLSPLVLLASEMILKFLKISNACYILTEASHFHAYALVASVQGYIACSLETFLEGRMLEDLSSAVIKQLSTFIRSKQEEKAFFVRGGSLVKRALEVWKDWIEDEDIPGITVPSTSQKKERERKPSQATKHSPSSPSQLSMTALGKQREVHVTAQGSPVLRPRTSNSPIIKPNTSTSPLIKSKGDADELFDMDDMDIGPPSIPVERPPMTWKTSSTPRVDMRTVMAEAASSSDSPRPNPVYVPPRGSPSSSGGTETPFSSLRMRPKPATQRSIFDGPSTPPTSNVRHGGSPWKTTVTQSPNQAPLSPAVQAKDSPPPMAVARSRDSSSVPRMQPGQTGLGPVFTPARQPVSKPSPSAPRRVSSNSTKAWTPAPVREPVAQNTAGMSFVAIQQLQLEQGAEVPKDKRSLLEIQQEEKAKREEEDFLKWWEAEEERVRLDTEAALRLSMESSTARGGSGAGRRGRGSNQSQKPRKPKANKDSGPSSHPESGTNTGTGNRRGPKVKNSKADKAPPRT